MTEDGKSYTHPAAIASNPGLTRYTHEDCDAFPWLSKDHIVWLHRLSKGNDAPTEEERDIIHENITLISNYIDQRIALGTVRNSIISSMNTKRVLKVYGNVLSPVRLLPFEIIEKIAHFYSPFHKIRIRTKQCARSGGKGVVISSGPWLCGRVCSSWRLAVMSSPFLWGDVHLRGRWEGMEHKKAAAVLRWLLEEGIRRSGSAPLSLEWEGSRIFEVTEPILRPFSNRWKSICIRKSNADSVRGDVFSAMSLPILESFALHYNAFPDIDPGYSTLLLGEAPSLRSISLTHIRPTDVSIPWAQVASVKLSKIGYLPFGLLEPWLSQCEKLQILDFADGYGGCSNAEDEIQHIIWSYSIESLSIPDTGIFRRLALPKLGTLAIDRLHYDHGYDTDAGEFDKELWYHDNQDLREFLTRSACNIHTLKIKQAYFKGVDKIQDFIDTLTLLSHSLSVFSLTQDWDIEAVKWMLHSLTQSRSNSDFPNLSEFEFVVSHPDSYSSVLRSCNKLLLQLAAATTGNDVADDSPPAALGSLESITLEIRDCRGTVESKEGAAELTELIQQCNQEWKSLRSAGLFVSLLKGLLAFYPIYFFILTL